MKRIHVLLILVFCSCTIISNEKSILDISNCELPCWNNINPGQTTEKELLEIVEEQLGINKNRILNAGKAWNTFDNRIYFSITRNLDVEAYVLNDRIAIMDLKGILSINFGQMVERIGYPNYIITVGGHDGSISVIALYPEKGVGYTSYAVDGDLDLQQSDEVQSLAIFDHNLYIDLLDAGMFSNGFFNARQTQEVMYPWSGYGDIDDKYPIRLPSTK